MIEKGQLEKIKLSLITRLSEEFIDPKVDFMFIENEILMRVQAFVYGEYGTDVVIKHPKNLWNYIKEQFFPEFILNKYPIKYKTYTITPQTIYPNFKISMPDEKHVPHILKKKGEC